MKILKSLFLSVALLGGIGAQDIHALWPWQIKPVAPKPLMSRTTRLPSQFFNRINGRNDLALGAAGVALYGAGRCLHDFYKQIKISCGGVGNVSVRQRRPHAAHADEGEEVCPICQNSENIKKGWPHVINLGCNEQAAHFICVQCLDGWITSRRQQAPYQQPGCPLCRKTITIENIATHNGSKGEAREKVAQYIVNISPRVVVSQTAGPVVCNAAMLGGSGWLAAAATQIKASPTKTVSLQKGLGLGVAAGVALGLAQHLLPKYDDDQSLSDPYPQENDAETNTVILGKRLLSKTWIRRPVVCAALGALAGTVALMQSSQWFAKSLVDVGKKLGVPAAIGLAGGAALEGGLSLYRNRQQIKDAAMNPRRTLRSADVGLYNGAAWILGSIKSGICGAIGYFV